MTIAGLNIYYQGLKVEDAYYDHISDRVVFNLEDNKRAFQTLDQQAVEHEMGWRAERAEIKTLLSVWGLKAEPAANTLNYLNRVYLKGEPTLQWTIPPPRQIDSSLWTGREDQS